MDVVHVHLTYLSGSVGRRISRVFGSGLLAELSRLILIRNSGRSLPVFRSSPVSGWQDMGAVRAGSDTSRVPSQDISDDSWASLALFVVYRKGALTHCFGNFSPSGVRARSCLGTVVIRLLLSYTAR